MVPVATDVLRLILSRASLFHLTICLWKIDVHLLRFLPALSRPPCLFFLMGLPRKLIKLRFFMRHVHCHVLLTGKRRNMLLNCVNLISGFVCNMISIKIEGGNKVSLFAVASY
jgi:hypothetical protein